MGNWEIDDDVGGKRFLQGVLLVSLASIAVIQSQQLLRVELLPNTRASLATHQCKNTTTLGDKIPQQPRISFSDITVHRSLISSSVC